MKPTEISLRRKFNLGNYESIDVEVVAILDPQDIIPECLGALEIIINNFMEVRKHG